MNKNIKIILIVMLFDLLFTIFFFNIRHIIHLSEKYLIIDIIGGIIIIWAILINILILILIKRKIYLLKIIDLYLLHIIIIYVNFIILLLRYNIPIISSNSINLFVFGIIYFIIYILYSIILYKKNKRSNVRHNGI